MLRICGVTFDHTVNYGSCLQAYALQKAVEKIKVHGEACTMVNIPFKRMKEYPKSRFAVKLIQPPFSHFLNNNMHFADITTLADLESLNSRYDAFICGGDVVWNIGFNHGFDAYYLRFATKYAFSYAASFGTTDLDEEYLKSLQEKMSRLRQISVREPSAVKVIENNTTYKACLAVDPVLLLNREEWNAVAAKAKRQKEFIFAYFTHLNETVEGFVKKLQEQTGLEVKYAVFGPQQAKKYRVYPMTPEKWIQSIRDARFVVTNSYHGSLFSIIFRKSFFTVLHGEKHEGINIRMTEFLTNYGLENRVYTTIPDRIPLDDLSYDEDALRILDNQIAESKRFIENNLLLAYTEKGRGTSK